MMPSSTMPLPTTLPTTLRTTRIRTISSRTISIRIACRCVRTGGAASCSSGDRPTIATVAKRAGAVRTDGPEPRLGGPVSVPPMTRFDAVLFDAGGVLVLPDPNVIGPLLAHFGGPLDVESHRRAHYAAMAAKSRAGSIEGVWDEYDVSYVASLGITTEPDVAAEVLGCTRTAHLWRWPIPETRRALAQLDAAGVPMGVVSNASGQVEGELRRSAICQTGAGPGVEVRVVVDSHVVGVAKPDPAIFDHALSHFSEHERSRVLYVGDSVTMDIGSASAAGLHPVLIDPYDDHDGADFERITAVGDIVDWF